MADFIYNSVEAPALPETALPVALILHTSAADMLVLTEAVPTISGESIVWANGVRQHYQRVDGAWVFQLEDTGDGIVGVLGDGIAWTNTDILYADGTVYLAASEPVPVKWAGLKSWLTGFALGLAGKPLPLAVQKEPVAWLYNGVRLPKLPEWDRETYPYAAIFQRNNYSWLYASESAMTVAVGFAGEQYTYISAKWKHYDTTGGPWELVTAHYPDGVYSYNTDTSATILWSNHDIIDTDENAVYFEKSADPIPVYE